VTSGSALMPGDFASVVYDAVPIWSTDIGTNQPFGYLDYGDVVVILQFSDASGAEYWLVVSKLGCGYVYTNNIVQIN
jgi:hypothetical protein